MTGFLSMKSLGGEVGRIKKKKKAQDSLQVCSCNLIFFFSFYTSVKRVNITGRCIVRQVFRLPEVEK